MNKTNTNKKFKIVLLLMTLVNLGIVLAPILIKDATNVIACYATALCLTLAILIVEKIRVQVAMKEWTNTPDFTLKDANWKERPRADKSFVAINLFLIGMLCANIFIRL